MIVTTTNSVEGHKVTRYITVVSGEVIMGANIIRDLAAGIRDLTGGRSKGYEKTLQKSRSEALNEMVQNAQAVGANAVIGVDIDYETVGQNGSMLMVTVSGTAVVLE